jgi:hypothetical protein
MQGGLNVDAFGGVLFAVREHIEGAECADAGEGKGVGGVGGHVRTGVLCVCIYG